MAGKTNQLEEGNPKKKQFAEEFSIAAYPFATVLKGKSLMGRKCNFTDF